MAQQSLLYSNDVAATYPDSWYAASTEMPSLRSSLYGAAQCDVLIVGAGFTGLSAALFLAERDYNVCVVDAHRVGWGASGRNGGQLGSGQRVDQDDLENSQGSDEAKQLWDLAEQSKTLVKSLIAKHRISCEFQPGIIHADHKRRFSEHSRAYVEKLQVEYDYRHIEFINGDALGELLGTDAYCSGFIDSDAGHLHPLKYALGLARAAELAGAVIFEKTQVRAMKHGDSVLVTTAQGQIKAKHVLLACNGYLENLNREVAAHVMPINNFIIATEPLADDLARSIIRNNMAVADSRFVVNYYRKSIDKRLLFGGRESYGYRFPDDIKSFVRSAMLHIYPQLNDTRIDYGWGGTLAITMNRMPYLRAIKPNVISACGYSGHGVGMATLSGTLAAQAIDGNMSNFDVLARIGHRRFPGGAALRSPLLKLGMLYYSLRDYL